MSVFKNILIIHANNNNNGIKKHSEYIKREINCDTKFLQTDFNYDDLNKYNIIIWQNVFQEIKEKKSHNIYIYIVHTNSKYLNINAIDIIKKNDKYIDKYIFVSEDVLKSFEKNIMKVDNYLIIENKTDFIHNNGNIEKGLCISYGGYSILKNHIELIKLFKTFDKEKYKLEIYGEITNRQYYDGLLAYIERYKINNIKLFGYNSNYIDKLKQAEYYFTLSKSEGCSYTLLESMMLDKNIITSPEACNFDKIIAYPKKQIYDGKLLQNLDFDKIKTKKDIYKFDTWKNSLLEILNIKKDNLGIILEKNILSFDFVNLSILKYNFNSKQWENQEFEGLDKNKNKYTYCCALDSNSILVLWNEENKNLLIYKLSFHNDKLLFTIMKIYTINNIKCMTINKEKENIWLSIGDNYNLKLYCCNNDIWEKNYRILYHNDKIIEQCGTIFDEKQNLIFSLYDEKEKFLLKNEEMYRLDIIPDC